MCLVWAACRGLTVSKALNHSAVCGFRWEAIPYSLPESPGAVPCSPASYQLCPPGAVPCSPASYHLCPPGAHGTFALPPNAWQRVPKFRNRCDGQEIATDIVGGGPAVRPPVSVRL